MSSNMKSVPDLAMSPFIKNILNIRIAMASHVTQVAQMNNVHKLKLYSNLKHQSMSFKINNIISMIIIIIKIILLLIW